jgi:hypothetical protein
MLKSLAVGAVGLLVMVCAAMAADEKAAAEGQPAGGQPAAAKQSGATPKWAMNATIIEACSCPMFCQCYFSTKPASHGGGGHAGHGAHGEHFCKFNNAYRVNKGHFGDVSLDGAKFWIGGDLGAEFDDGEMDWAVLTFDPSVKTEQREGIIAIVNHVYPVKWKSFTVSRDAPVEWRADKNQAVARLNGGRDAEIQLKRWQGNTSEPVVIHNLKYWGTPRNEGFVLMPNEVEAKRRVPRGQKPFEFKGTNGFMITFDITSNDRTMPAVKDPVRAERANPKG